MCKFGQRALVFTLLQTCFFPGCQNDLLKAKRASVRQFPLRPGLPMLAMMEVAPRPARAGLAGIHSRRLRGLPVQGKPVRLNPVRVVNLSIATF